MNAEEIREWSRVLVPKRDGQLVDEALLQATLEVAAQLAELKEIMRDVTKNL